ncbi:MAG TPA: N-acetylmuramic acid 6-phosphate etherase [Pseudonocardia sp.]|uniref:N-acetylmuramic acid 6-phosphate etherase n=1 Tax=Pseudonocardia sp. TaxID=60912 RepID=UPI002C1A1C2B|nr:N-acetylmuramic acid 6-phosphate etherase [Pseudonocardia sp.]HTF48860.1 N-acetylmuramic acid 6-phosphate etherase [Pseudonocardia sp.]
MTAEPTVLTTVAVDIGRSTTRVRVTGASASDSAASDSAASGSAASESGPATGARRGAGAGLGDQGGADAVARLVRDAVGAGPCTPWRLAVGVPGALAHPAAADALARQLGRGWPRPPELVLVASDIAAWHAGALPDRDGVVLSVGTGAVALGVCEHTVRQADGRGLLLGDEGGGAWIGLAGLRAAARAADGRGPATSLSTMATPSSWESALPTAAALAALAPAVLAAARHGDPVATGILEAGADALARTAIAAGTATGVAGETTDATVAVVGGLAEELLPRLRLRHPEIAWVEPDGDAMSGLVWLLEHTGSALESGLIRIRPAQDRPSLSANAITDVDALPTEALRPGSEQIDLLPTSDLVARLVDGQAVAVPSVARAAGAIATAVDYVAAALRRGGRMVYVGAGTPGRLAVQDAAELTPTFGVDPARVPTLLAGGDCAATAAVENAEDDIEAARAAVAEAGIDGDDVVIGVSASGRTPFVAAALAAARERGAVTVAMVCTAAAPAARDATVVIELLTGPEVLAGSTRLAAGTAQKVALNTLSTAAMVRTGGTYGGWMVGIRPTNAKLRRRAVRIVRDATGLTEEVAAQLLTASAGDVRTALVSGLTGLDPSAAGERLAATGSVRAAVDSVIGTGQAEQPYQAEHTELRTCDREAHQPTESSPHTEPGPHAEHARRERARPGEVVSIGAARRARR